MRLFGGDRVQGLMGTLGIDEDTPIENRMITSTIESAQKKLEGRNFEIRKNVLKYDDVMNQQREIIYGQRRKVLDGEDISAEMHNMLKENIESSCKQFLAGDVKDEWDFGALRRHYLGWLTTDADFHYTVADYDSISQESIADMLYQRGMDVLNDKEQRYGAPLMRELERICLLKCVDRQWMDHIDNMDQLRQGIVLRGYGQKDPVVEYRIEGFDMFDQMVDSIRESSVKMLLTIEVREAGKADVGIYHIGGVRLDSLAGEVVAADIYNLDPFGSKLVTAEMTADELARLVKTKFNDTVNLDESHRIDIYMTTPYVIRTDERFEAQSVVFPELKSGRRYRVAMGDYIFKTYSGLDYTDGAPTGTLLTDVLDSYLRARSPLAPDNEPRQRIE